MGRTEHMGQAVDKEGLLAILEPAVTAMGFELADIDAYFGRRGLLRLYIDRAGGVTVDDCQRVSEQVGALLDVEDPLPGSYVLEVSSPGFDRRLRTLAHFERFGGEQVKVELKDAREGRRNFKGRLVGVEGSEVLLEVDGELTRLPFGDIAVARLAPP
ncbi:MAG TPA: ribosome maturation factor RimP [Gammaproteobacteria bacterium]|nr:ribosome maturation factor RimP [Gammaproteobacteria bacterium]